MKINFGIKEKKFLDNYKIGDKVVFSKYLYDNGGFPYYGSNTNYDIQGGLTDGGMYIVEDVGRIKEEIKINKFWFPKQAFYKYED